MSFIFQPPIKGVISGVNTGKYGVRFMVLPAAYFLEIGTLRCFSLVFVLKGIILTLRNLLKWLFKIRRLALFCRGAD